MDNIIRPATEQAGDETPTDESEFDGYASMPE